MGSIRTTRLGVVVVLVSVLSLVGPGAGADPVRAAPSPPTGVSAAAISEGFGSVSWTPAVPHGSPVTGYRVASDEGGFVADVGPTATSAQFTTLTDGIAYRFRVYAKSADGNSAWSAWSNPVRPSVCTDGIRGPGPFPDVPELHPFCIEIDWMSGSEITTAYPDGTFRPALDVTRQAMAAFLLRAFGPPVVAEPLVPTYSDVPPTHPFYAEIEWATSEGLVEGYPDGTFRPSNPVTRQAMAAFLYRAEGEPPVVFPPTPPFSDVPFSHPFAAAIQWMVTQDIAEGFPDGTFRPTVPVTRQAASAFLFRDLDGDYDA